MLLPCHVRKINGIAMEMRLVREGGGGGVEGMGQGEWGEPVTPVSQDRITSLYQILIGGARDNRGSGTWFVCPKCLLHSFSCT